MIIIEDIKIKEIPDKYKYYQERRVSPFKSEPQKINVNELAENVFIETELIKPINFHVSRIFEKDHFDLSQIKVTDTYSIGWTKAVEKALNLPMEHIKQLKDMNHLKHKKIMRLESELGNKKNKIKNMTFFQRLKFLFTKKMDLN